MEDLAVRLDRATCNRQTFVYHTDSLLWYTQGEVWRIWPFVWIGLPAIDNHSYTILTHFYGTHRARYGGFGRSSG